MKSFELSFLVNGKTQLLELLRNIFMTEVLYINRTLCITFTVSQQYFRKYFRESLVNHIYPKIYKYSEIYFKLYRLDSH